MYGNTFRQVLNDTAQRLRDRQNSPAGLVRINAPVVFGQKHIAPWLAELAGHYPEYVSRFGFPLSPADLAAHRLLVYNGVMGAQRIFLSRGDQAPIIHAPDAILLSNNAETLVNAALKGADIVLMPDWQAGELLRQKRFIRLLPEWQAGVSQEKALLPWSIPGRGLSR
nr:MULTISPECIES: LysR substrate-binding domain-containing protein [unclassified Tatumella]